MQPLGCMQASKDEWPWNRDLLRCDITPAATFEARPAEEAGLAPQGDGEMGYAR